MRQLQKGLILSALVLFALGLFGQKNVTTFGIQIKPIIETGIIGGTDFTIRDGSIGADIIPRSGMSFGMVIRRGFTESVSLEVGINRVTRRFDYDFFDQERPLERSLSYGYVNYEIPVKGLVFVRLGERLFLNNSLGPSLDFYASDVASGDLELQQVTRRGQWAKVALEANVGMEYRTRKSGYIYFGTTYHNPFSRIARSSIRYRDDQSLTERYLSFDLKGGYLTLDIKYFFHEPPERN